MTAEDFDLAFDGAGVAGGLDSCCVSFCAEDTLAEARVARAMFAASLVKWKAELDVRRGTEKVARNLSNVDTFEMFQKFQIFL